MKGTSEVRLAGLVAVRIAWITAYVVCALVILIGLFSGTDGGNSSQQSPGFAFSDGRDSSHQWPEFALPDPAAAMVGAAAQEDRRSDRAKEGAAGDSHSRSDVPPRSGSQPEDTGGRTPVVTPRPKPPQAPAGDPAEAPQAPAGDPAEAPQAPAGDPADAPQAPEGDPADAPQAPSVTRPKPPKPPKA